MENVNISELVERLGSDEDGTRKMAAFRLQSVIGDPSFADVFINEGGVPKLSRLVLQASGNTLAYSLTSFSRLLELDKGWEKVTPEMIERVVELVVKHPLVNILRGAMSILAAVVSHPQNSRGSSPAGQFGFKALKPAIGVYPQFLEMLVRRLSSADHALCANSLQLINSLMRDAVSQDVDRTSVDGETRKGHVSSNSNSSNIDRGTTTDGWPKFIKKLQDLGVIKSVYTLMQSSAVQDLAHPLLEFQSLTKVLLRKWREEKVDLERPEHRRALKGLHLAGAAPERHGSIKSDNTGSIVGGSTTVSEGGSRRQHPEKWRRLGFQSEQPSHEFAETGFLGMMDLTDYVRKREDGFARLLLEQSGLPGEKRCPVARASIAVTSILYDHYEVDKANTSGSEEAQATRFTVSLESRTHFEKAFKPLLLQWSRLHTAGLNAFLRLWKSTGATVEDFGKVEELVRILVEQVVGQAPRTQDVQVVEEEMVEFDVHRLRELQMELLELTYEDVWGHHLRSVREELNHEALQFVKEQRIRCLLRGSWFPQALGYGSDAGPITSKSLSRNVPSSWRYVRLSHNRRFLHYADFPTKKNTEPQLDVLTEKIDLSIVSSVVSNVSASTPSTASSSDDAEDDHTNTHQEPRNQSGNAPPSLATKIIIHGWLKPDHDSATAGSRRAGGHKNVPSTGTATTGQAGAAPSQQHRRQTSKSTAQHDTRSNAVTDKTAKESNTTATAVGNNNNGAPSKDARPSTDHHGRPGTDTTATATVAGGTSNGASNDTNHRESTLLTLHPQTHTLAAEWLDGLLMLLNQQPITADTTKLVSLVAGYGLKIRLLNVSFDSEKDGGTNGSGAKVVLGKDGEGPEMPGREGVDEEFWYDIGGLEAGA